MSVDSIADELSSLAYRLDSMRSHQATTEGLRTTEVLRETAAMLRTRQDFKGVEIDQFKKLNRSRWEGCEVCCSESCEICRHDGDFYSCTSYFRCTCEEYEPLKFCPNCGRPLTEQARSELERRINGGTADIF